MTAARARTRRERKAPTIFDVAAAAEVLKSTVSNVVRGVEVSEATRARRAGYRAAMRKGGRTALTPLRWEPGAASVRAGRVGLELARALREPDAPTALFVSNDIGAIAMIETCETLGINVPGDISIVGFDDIALAGLHRISLTTVAQSLDFQAERAVALLMERIENPHIEPRHESVAVELKVRDSTGPPPGRRERQVKA